MLVPRVHHRHFFNQAGFYRGCQSQGSQRRGPRRTAPPERRLCPPTPPARARRRSTRGDHPERQVVIVEHARSALSKLGSAPIEPAAQTSLPAEVPAVPPSASVSAAPTAQPVEPPPPAASSAPAATAGPRKGGRAGGGQVAPSKTKKHYTPDAP